MSDVTEILGCYVDVAEAARTPEFFVRAQQRKDYLTEDVIKLWRLGRAPTLQQCLDGGLTEKQLRSVGLLCDPQSDGPDKHPYMFFRDCIIIPYRFAGDIIYVSSRRLSDTMPDGSPADKAKKALSMRSPVMTDSGPWGGVQKPCGFNLDVFNSQAAKDKGIVLVEGALDAIACCERGRPAVAYLGSSIKPALAELVRTTGLRCYVAPDGTADMTDLKRAELAAAIGPEALVCYLPEGEDPDDQNEKQLAALIDQAIPTTLAFSKALSQLEKAHGLGSKQFTEALTTFGEWVLAQEKAGALSDIDRVDVRQALKMSEDDYSLWLSKESPTEAQEAGSAGTPEVSAAAGGTPTGQPDPLVAIADPEVRELCNYVLVERDIPEHRQTKNGPKTEWVPQKIPLNSIIERILSTLDGWPCRLFAPGAQKPVLFADAGQIAAKPQEVVENQPSSELCEAKSRARTLLAGREEINRIKLVGSVEQMRRWLHRNFRLKFRDRLDCNGANFVSFADVFQDLGGCDDVSEYLQVETRPHYPAIGGHYYAFTEHEYENAPAVLKLGCGGYLEAFLQFFDNVDGPVSRAVLAAAIVTPGWGGLPNEHYGKRPAFVITAPDRGFGKTTIAEMIAFLWGGHLSINYEQRNEEELFQRLLSVEALLNRVVIIDNVKGTFASSTVEGLITAKKISGKRLYHGEATRPNTLTYFVTANQARMSRDMALRSYFIQLVKPAYRSEWDENLADFLAEHWRDVLADCKRLLQADPRSESKRPDRWGPWRKCVLAKVCDFLGEISADDVVEAVEKIRGECDDDLRESRMLIEGVVEKLCWREKLIWLSDDQVYTVHDIGPAVDLFVPSTKLCEWFREIMNKDNLGTKQVAQIIEEHHGAGRLQELTPKRAAAANGYLVSAEAVRRFLKEKSAANVEGVLK